MDTKIHVTTSTTQKKTTEKQAETTTAPSKTTETKHDLPDKTKPCKICTTLMASQINNDDHPKQTKATVLICC